MMAAEDQRTVRRHTRRPRLNAYEVRNLVDQLIAARQGEFVHRLFSIGTRRRSWWYATKQRADDERGYERELATAWRMADEAFCCATDRGTRAAATVAQIRYALIRASLEAMSAGLTPETLVERITRGEWAMSQARLAAGRVPEAGARAQLLATLATAASGDDVVAVVADALRDPGRAQVLPVVAARLPVDRLTSVVSAAQALRTDDVMADAVVAVAPYLAEDQVGATLRAALSIRGAEARARAVTALNPRLPADLAEQALLDGDFLGAEGVVLSVLEEMAPRLTASTAARGLEVLAGVAPSARRARVAATLLGAVGPVAGREAARVEHAAALKVRARDERAVALAALGHGAEALSSALSVGPEQRGTTIAAVASSLTPALARRAVEAVADLPSPSARCDALVGLAPVLDASSTLAALKVVEGVKRPRARARMLVHLAPRLPQPRVARALKLALEIRDVEARGVALAALEPHLTDRHREIPKYRRRAVAVDAAAILRSWEGEEPPVEAPAGGGIKAAETTSADGEQAADHDHRRAASPREVDRPPAPPRDGPALHRWLLVGLEAGPTESSALRAWFRSKVGARSPGAQPPVDRVITPLTLPGLVRPMPAGEATRRRLRSALRKRIQERDVALSDPDTVRSLDTLEPIELRTALHLGLEEAERYERDDDVEDVVFSHGRFVVPSFAYAVAPFARHGRVSEVVEAAGQLEGPYRRAEALAATLAHLPEGNRPAVAAEAWESVIAAAHASSPLMWAQGLRVLEPLVELVDSAAIRRMAAALRALAHEAEERTPPADSARAIVIQSQMLLMLHAAPRTAAGLATEAFATAGRSRSPTLHALVLEAFTPVVPRPAVADGARLARRLRGVHARAGRLAALADRAAELGDHATASRLVVEIAALRGALGDRAMLLLVADRAHLVSPDELARIWCPGPGQGLLHEPQNASRSGLLEALDAFEPALRRLGGRGLHSAVDRTVDRVREWWP